MKKIIFLLIISLNILAEDGKEIHDESCIECHIATHNSDFYTKKDSKMDTMLKLRTQVSMCATTFETGWFPEEQKSVVEYLNSEFYKLEK